MRKSPIFKLENVCLEINGNEILQDMSLEISPDTITSIIGPSGSGKSTFLRLLNRLLEPTKGSIYYQDQLLTSYSPRELRKRVSYVQQRPYLFPGTIKDNLLYGPRLWGIKYSDNELRGLLEQVSLEPEFLDQDIANLSEGEKQRVNIARSLANQPNVLLLDEPTSALDVLSVKIIEELLLRLKKKGVKLLIVTHNLEQTKRVSDEVLVLNAGRVLDYISIDEFLHSRSEEEIMTYFKKNNGDDAE